MFLLNHLYFSVSLFILIFIWMPLFIINKTGRRWMIYMSLVGIILGLPVFQKMYITDWWQPNFIFPSSYIKIEDLLFGAGIVGIISSIYSFLRSKDKNLLEKKGFSTLQKIIIVLVVFSIFLGMFYVLHLHSFWISVIASSLGAIVVATKKPAFLKHAILTGLILATSTIPVYLMCLKLNPDFINNEWLLHKLSGKMLLSIPIEEIIWYIFAGIGISALQEGVTK